MSIGRGPGPVGAPPLVALPLIGQHVLVPQFDGGRVYSKSIERMGVGIGLTERQKGYLSKYDGLVSHLGNCIFILEFESLTADTITETILFPPCRKRLDVLTGMSLGVSSRLHRQIFSTLIAWKYLGQNIDMRAALAKCGLLAKTDRSIDRSQYPRFPAEQGSAGHAQLHALRNLTRRAGAAAMHARRLAPRGKARRGMSGGMSAGGMSGRISGEGQRKAP